jgi:hypothetical protein
VCQGDCHDLTPGVRQGAIVGNHCGQRQASREEDKDELHGCHLLAGTPARGSHDQHQKTVAKKGSQNRCQMNFLKKWTAVILSFEPRKNA